MIAAESLFLSDVNRQDRGEMRYRLSHRAALFIDSPDYPRRAVFQYMRRAYDARSAVVHGAGVPDPKDLESPAGEALSIHGFTEITETLMRAALLKAIPIGRPGGRLGVDWDALIFPD